MRFDSHRFHKCGEYNFIKMLIHVRVYDFFLVSHSYRVHDDLPCSISEFN